MVLWTLKNKEECDFFFSLFYYSEILHYRSKNKYLRNKFDSTAECSFSSDCSVYPSALIQSRFTFYNKECSKDSQALFGS